MPNQVATYGEILGKLRDSTLDINLLVQILPGHDFHEVVHAIRSDDFSAKTLADLFMNHVIQILHPDEAEDVGAATLLPPTPGLAPPLINADTICRVEGYETAIFFQVIDGGK